MSTFLENDGHYKFFVGGAYPVGTYPLSPFEAGEQHGWDTTIRPDEDVAIDPSIASREDFQAGVLKGINLAREADNNYGEEEL